MLCLVFSSYMVSCSLTCPYLKACWKGENSHGRPHKFLQGRGQHHHITYIFQVADVAMQMDVHKTLCCFYTTKKMPHESTHSICIYFEIFFKWSCIRVCRKCTSCYLLQRLLNWCINLVIIANSTMGVGRVGKAPWILKFLPKKGCFLVSSGKKQISSLFPPPRKI